MGEGCDVNKWSFTMHQCFGLKFSFKLKSILSSKVKTIQQTLMRLQSKGLNAILIVDALNSSLDRNSDRGI